MTSPYPPSSSAQILAAQNGPWAQFRTGTVVSFAVNQAVVSIGGAQVQCAYLDGATFTAGDLVYVSRQDASWVIHGRLAGVGPNLLVDANFSFEDSPSGTFPSQWILANTTATSNAIVRAVPHAPDGLQVASVGTISGGATAYLYSALPIPVVTGDQFNVSAYAGGDYEVTDTLTADAALVALWFANDTDLYPTTSSADTVIVTATDIVQAPPYTTLSGTVSAPVTGYMRLALRTSTIGTQQVLWDQVIVRRV